MSGTVDISLTLWLYFQMRYGHARRHRLDIPSKLFLAAKKKKCFETISNADLINLYPRICPVSEELRSKTGNTFIGLC